MNKTIPKIKVMHIKTKTVHYARYALRAPEPICYTAIATNKNYTFTDQPVTCKYCQQYFENKAQVIEGYWSKQIEKALEVRKIHACPFELFANKYGYDLKHDNLIFPDSAPEFMRRRFDYYGLPHRGWKIQHAIDVGGLPKNVTIGSVCSRTDTFFDKVLLVKFMNYDVDGLLVTWELIKEQTMKKSVELYVGYSDSTWNTMVVEVSINTPYNALEHVAGKEAAKICWEKERKIVSFAHICSTDPEEFGE